MINGYMENHDYNNMKRKQIDTINSINEEVLHVLELTPTNRQKSFYGKAKVIETRSRVYLLSYYTLICYFDHNTGTFTKLWNDYSVTTQNHINSFMDYLNINKGGKKWWTELQAGYAIPISQL